MPAKVGDQVLIHGRAVGIPEKAGEIIEVLGPDGGPPYRVRFDDGSESVVLPGPETVIRSN